MDGNRTHAARWFRPAIALVGIGLIAFLLYPVYSLWVSETRGPYYNSAALADFEGDGDLDVAVVNLRKESEVTFWHVITFWTNQGGGRFTPERIDLGPYLYLAAAAGDLDRDGDDDFAILSVPNLALYLNQGGLQGGETGDFKIGQSISPHHGGYTISSVQLGDLNGNGNLDAFVSGCGMSFPKPDSELKGCSPTSTWVWLNGGSQGGRLASQVPSQVALGEHRIRSTALGDLDLDGDLDVFAALQGPETREISGAPDQVFLNDGSGTFQDSGQRLGDEASSAVALGDLDSDGDLDALVGAERGAQVWINQGGAQGGQGGEFTAGKAFEGGKTTAIFLQDLNGDGYPDALVGEVERATIWWNDGNGAFTRSYQRFRYSERHALAVGDFNGDGLPDIFAAAYETDYRVWYNHGEGRFK